MDPGGQYPGGRGRGQQVRMQQQVPHQDDLSQRRELRRPMGPGDDLARQMAGMDPFNNGGYGYQGQGGGGGVPQPAPSADGWSSGENQFDDPSRVPPQHQQQQHGYQQQFQQQQDYQQFQQQGYHNQRPRNQYPGGGGYRGNRGGRGNRYNNHNNYYNPGSQNMYGNRSWQAGGGHQQPRHQYNPHYQQQQQQQQHYQQQQQLAAAAAALEPQLSATASEFVPKTSLSASAMEFVPRAGPRNTSKWAFEQQQQAPQQQQQLFSGDPKQQVEQGMAALLYSPGRFDQTAAQLSEGLNASVSDLATLRQVVDLVLEQSLAQANFRYTGARLLDHLSAAVTVSVSAEEDEDKDKKTTLSEVLLERFRSLHSGREELLKSDVPRFRSLALFTADLFLQLGTPDAEGGAKKRMPELGVAATELLSALAERQRAALSDKEDVRAIAQALKMAGGALEEEEKKEEKEEAGGTPRMDSLMASVEALGSLDATPAVPKHMLQMMANLVDLRKSGWGASAAAAAAPAANQQQQSSGGAVWSHPQGGAFDPMGGGGADFDPNSGELELTAEEEAFMKEHLGADVLGEDPDDEDFGAADPDDPDIEDMPPEIAAAYEEFIASQTNEAEQQRQ